MATWRGDALRRKLRLLATQDGLLEGIHKDVQLLCREFGAILPAIDRCESLHDELNAQAKGWVNRARELGYDIEDWADLLLLDVQVCGGALGSRILSRLYRDRLMLPVRVTASKLQELKERVVELIQQWERLSLPVDPLEPDPVDSRLSTTPPFVDVGCLVGFDEPMEVVTKMVTGAGGKNELKVISIVGMAGSGKTTLAAAVYQQLRQHNGFQLQAFVSVGRKPDAAGKALEDMLSELGDGHKSCLIVVDDLWSTQDWHHIKSCFPEDSFAGSRIITTTRNLQLAKECCRGSSDYIYNIGLLNEVDSKKLILDRAFGIGHGCPPQLEDALAQITRRCSGLPLALVTVASMLEGKFSKDEWHRLIGSRWSSDAEVMKQIFNRSYNDLPHHLKACLLDLSIFPVDFKIDVDHLMRRWMADGYIDEDVEEIARTSINELINRNMVQRLPPVHGAPRYCRLLPVIHDFVLCKSMEYNFVTLVGDHNPPVSTNCTVSQWLSVQSSKYDQNQTSYDGMDLSHVRSITVFGQASAAPRLINLRAVRVLDLEGCVGPVCLDNLDKLLLLRYLSLKGTDIAELPAALWELRFLESLDVRSTKVKQLPPSIVGLRRSLRTLLFGHEGMINSVETATRIAEDTHDCYKLENVATINLREHLEGFVEALGCLNRLRELEITWSFHQCTVGACCEALLSSMQQWGQLKSLTIHCGLGCCMEFLGSLSNPPRLLKEFKVTAGVFVSVPDWIKMLGYLSFLQITICKIGREDLNLLRNLHQLECLILGLDFVPRNAIVIESDGFSELLSFSVDCPAPWLIFQEGAMPRLTHLQLEFCSGSMNPESVPSGIRNLQRLTEVVLLYNQKWCADSYSVRATVDAVKRQVAKHRNRIDLIINGTKADVQKVEEEMKNTSEIQSADVGEIARTTVETQGEIEIEET